MRIELPMMGLEDCGCCQTVDPDRDSRGELYGCHQKSTVLTEREEAILEQIRELSLKAQGIKGKMQQLGAEGEAEEAARVVLGEELASLRQRRSELESERIAAAEERMRLLGHV